MAVDNSHVGPDDGTCIVCTEPSAGHGGSLMHGISYDACAKHLSDGLGYRWAIAEHEPCDCYEVTREEAR